MQQIKKLSSEEFRKWNESHPYGNILQTEEWGKFKSRGEWTYELLGLESKGELQAACMMLKRKIPGLNRYMFYASRGFVLDYSDRDLIRRFTEALYAYAKEKKAVMIKIDPCVMYQEHDSEGILVENGKNNKDLVDYLISLSYRHKGITLDFDGIQPRFVYKLPLDRDLDQLLQKFHHKTRYNIRLAEKKGVSIVEGTKADLPEFYRIMQVTGSRDGFITRPLSYFEDMYDVMKESGHMKLYLAKYEEKVVSGTIMLLNGKTAVYLYGASDNVYRNIMPNYLIQWRMISDAYQMGCTMYDFRGISGDLNPENHLHGLFRFKKGFTGEFVEYIGEFDLVIRPFSYFLFETGVPLAKKVLRKIKKIDK